MNRSCEDRVALRLIDLHLNCVTLAVTVLGYIIPVLSLFVAVVNILAIIVFLKPKVKSNITIIFTFIAGVDVIGIACPSAVFVYHYILGYYKDFLTCSQIKVSYFLGRICEDMFKMLSIWLTVLLAFVRCQCIKYPFTARGTASTKRVALYITCICTIVCIVHIPAYFTFDFQTLKQFDRTKNTTYYMCGLLETEGFILKSCSRRKAHVVVTTVLDSILPCVFLIYFNSVMLYTLRTANKNRSSLRRKFSCEVRTKVEEMFSQSQHGTKDNEETMKTSDFEGEGKPTIDINNASEDNSLTKQHYANTDVCLYNQILDKSKVKFSTPRDPTLDKLDHESRRTSWLIFVVSSIILIHEIPLAFANTYTLIHHKEKPLPLSVTGCFSVVQLLWQFITYPVIFLISSCMSKIFRRELMKTIFCKYKCKKKCSQQMGKRNKYIATKAITNEYELENVSYYMN